MKRLLVVVIVLLAFSAVTQAQEFDINQLTPEMLNAQNDEGETVFFSVLQKVPRFNYILMFLLMGADPSIADNEGRTPFTYIMERLDGAYRSKRVLDIGPPPTFGGTSEIDRMNHEIKVLEQELLIREYETIATLLYFAMQR